MSPSTLHANIQNDLAELGNQLGFWAIKEYPLKGLYSGYSPIVDVVWFYPLSDKQSLALSKVYGLWPYWSGHRALYPYAAFEVTAKDATSKTIMAEMWNLKLAGFRYSFNIVPDKDLKHPDYMHKDRAQRIARTLKHFSGIDDVFVVSINDITTAISTMQDSSVNTSLAEIARPSKISRLKDTPHNNIMRRVAKFGEEHGFISAVEYTPGWLKKLEKRVTFIRHDVVWLLRLPFNSEVLFRKFLESLSILPTRDINPIEVLAFEVELGSFNKHSIGSVLNLAKITGRGVLVLENIQADLVKTVRTISSNRVDVKSVAECESIFS